MPPADDLGALAPVLRRCQDMVSRLEWEPLLESVLRTAILTAPAAGGALWVVSPDESPNPATGIRLHLVSGREGTPFPEAPSVLSLSQGQVAELGEKFAPFVDRLGSFVPCGQAAQAQQALFLPLQADGELYGLAALVPVSGGSFSDEHQGLLGLVGGFATAALGNARRVWTLEKSGFRERATSIYFLNHFIDFAAKEIYKARRYHRTFCLAVVSIDRYEFLRTRFKEEMREQYMRRWIECLTRVVRDADMVAKYAENEYFVLLPETDALGGRMFARRMLESTRADPMFLDMDRNYRVSTLVGTAAYPSEGRDYDELIAACRGSVERMRTSIHRRLELQDKSFWEMVELLIAWPEAAADGAAEVSDFSRWALYQNGASAHGAFSEELLRAMEEQAILQALDEPSRRVLLYESGDVLSVESTTGERLLAQVAGAKCFVLGRRVGEAPASRDASMTRVLLDDPALARFRIVLLLGERLAYAFLGEHRGEGGLYGFHSCDEVLVERLICKLQAHYNLHRQY